MKKTIILTQSEIKELIQMDQVLDAVEMAYAEHAHKRVQMPAKEYLFFEKGDLRIMPCYLQDLGESGVKCVNVHPTNPQKQDLPTVMAMIELVDPETGFPLAIMDGTWITNMRTGAAGGVAAKYLARKDVETLGLVGAGKQAYTQLMALNEVIDIQEAEVYCRTCSSREAFAKKMSETYDIPVKAVDSPQKAVENKDIVVTVTPVDHPVIKTEWISPGTHINAMGADAPGKEELETELVLKSRVFIDNWDQASHSGEINVPFSRGLLQEQDLAGNLGDVIIGKNPGRISDEEITIFDSTGLAVQDIATSWTVYEKAIEMKIGRSIDFLE
ncbi:alanine dehydrogenase [Methanobacterium alcaliphilum]|uniref:alanine dehydrogenase n=1 Tax=Methanobacterium alcaliphilum TaxID=392018 RepID=UPI00200A3A67|nr:alanine dehydrogenase [Methanobacterium alcaliphilum]MCK9152350.1 alanine dehydrogenase [Methanobacterium alcaliphilum]